MVSTCDLFGTANYTNSWLPGSVLVLIIFVVIVSFVYMASRVLSERARARMTEVVRMELGQIVISVVIIASCLTLSQTACSISSIYSQHFAGGAADPFTFATNYIGGLAFQKGLGLYSTTFSKAISYNIASVALQIAINKTLQRQPSLGMRIANSISASIGAATRNAVSISYEREYSPNIFSTIAQIYTGIISTTIMTSVGILLIQYIMLPFIQNFAFTVLIPVAIVMRAIPFGGGGIRNASNIFLAIAISMYIIYPLTIGLNSWMTTWVFSNNNPLYANYVSSSYTLINSLPGGSVSSGLGSNFFGSSTPTGLDVAKAAYASPMLPGAVAGIFSSDVQTAVGGSALNIGLADAQLETVIKNVAEYAFQVVALFGLDAAITVAFAASLARGLTTGLEGPIGFWGGI
jgi:hypothetical protein